MAKKKELDKITKGIIKCINTNTPEFLKRLEEENRKNAKLEGLNSLKDHIRFII